MTTVQQTFAMVPIDQLELGDNVRRNVDDVDTLVESIRLQGLIEPLVACPSADGQRVEVLTGQRRFTAARKAGLTHVPCVLRPRPDSRDRVLLQLAENLEREPMSPIDEALAFADLIDLGLSQTAIGHAVKRSPGEVSKRLKLLELPDVVRVAVDVGWVTPTAALEIPMPLCDDSEALDRLAKCIRAGDEAMRNWVRNEATSRRTSGRGTVTRKGVRVAALTIPAYELAAEHALRADETITEWVSAAIEQRAARDAEAA